MLKLNKKGFTIVELVIVIAVVAILAAVLIPTFIGLMQTAKTSADIQLVTSLNKVMAMQEALDGKNGTMYNALQDAKANGYDLSKLTPTSEGNDIVWDQSTDRFALVNPEAATDQILFWDESLTKPSVDSDKIYKLWKIYTEMPGEQTYSIYWAGTTAPEGLSTLTVGFDAGECSGISNLNYVQSTRPQTVVFRTNGGKLTVNAEKDTVSHYGNVADVTITAVAGDSYHEFGKVSGKITVNAGHVAIEEGAVVSQPVTVASTTGNVKITANIIINVVVAENTSHTVSIESDKHVFIDNQSVQKVNMPKSAVVAIDVNSEDYFGKKEKFSFGDMTDDANILDGYYKLTDNITVEHLLCVKEGSTVVIDLNGYSINSTFSGFVFGNWGTLTINDSSNQNTGCVYNTSKKIENGNFSHDAIRNFGTLTVNGGTFGDNNTNKSDDNSSTYGAAIYNKENAVCVINGGLFTCVDNYGKWANDSSSAYSYALRNYGTMTINSAEVYGKMNGAIACMTGTVTINNATVNLTGEKSFGVFYLGTAKGRMYIYGGSYTKSGNENYFAGWDSDDKNYHEITEGNALFIYGGTFTYNNKAWDYVIKKG